MFEGPLAAVPVWKQPPPQEYIGPQSWSGFCAEENISCPVRYRSPIPLSSLVAIPTELSRLRLWSFCSSRFEVCSRLLSLLYFSIDVIIYSLIFVSFPTQFCLRYSIPRLPMFSRRAGLCSGYALGLWSWGSRFESRPGWRLPLLLFFVLFLFPSRDNSSIKQRAVPYKFFPVHPLPTVRRCAGNLTYLRSRTINPRRKLSFPHTFSIFFLCGLLLHFVLLLLFIFRHILHLCFLSFDLS